MGTRDDHRLKQLFQGITEGRGEQYRTLQITANHAPMQLVASLLAGTLPNSEELHRKQIKEHSPFAFRPFGHTGPTV